MQREHRTLTGTTNEHQHQSSRNDEPSGSDSLRDIARNHLCGSLAHHDFGTMPCKGEAERVNIVAEHQDTNQEEHIGEAGHDECLLRGGDGRLQRIVEADEQVGADTHELPEHVHLEDVRGEHQAQHRHREETQERIVALEALLTVHIAERVDMNHQRHRGDDDEHHH